VSDEQAIDAETLRQLYTTPPNEFVAARTALVKERRQARDRVGAAAVAALRKTSGVDVALNLVAVEHPEVVASFLAAAAQVRDAQTAAAQGRSAASTRDALRDLRAQTALVVARAGETASGAGVTGSSTAAATARLGELVANEAAGEQLRAGILGSGAVEAVDPFGGAEGDAASPAAPRAPRSRPAAKAADSGPDRKVIARRRKLEEVVALATDKRAHAQEDVDTTDREVQEARAAITAAEAHLRESRQRLERAEDARVKAAARLERADAAVTDAADALAELPEP
jgi:hypothetical protein